MERARLKGEKTVGSYFVAQRGINFVHSGCTVLDCCLGGGWPVGRIVNLVGDKSTGKTLLGIEACVNFLRQYKQGRVYYLEAEAAFDKHYAAALGLPVEKVTFLEDVHTVEGFYREVMQVCSKPRRPAIFVVDSLDALSDTAEMERDIDKGEIATKARKMSQIFRRIARKVETSQVLLFIISQVRDKIGVVFGERHTRSGGKALDFYASTIVWLSEVGKLHKTISGIKRVVGVQIRAKVKKNKVGLPYRECEFPIQFGFGVDDVAACIQWLDGVGALKKALPDAPPVSKLLSRLDAMREPEYRALYRQVTTAVRHEWPRIEQQFLPARSKYG